MSDSKYQQPRQAIDAGSEILPITERLYSKIQAEDAKKTRLSARERREENLKRRKRNQQKVFDERTHRIRQAGVNKYGARVLGGTSRLGTKGDTGYSPNVKRPK